MEPLESILINEMRQEYIDELKEDSEDHSDTMITYPDIYVWFYNKDCQRALTEAKKIWEQTPSSPMGRKEMYPLNSFEFLSSYTSAIIKRHSRLAYLHKELPYYVIPT